MLKTLGVVCGTAMPFFNIPLIVRVIRRQSSEDISLVWVVGVWVCVIGMLPSSLRSPDPVLLIFGVMNTVFFTGVLICVLYFHPAIRKRPKPQDSQKSTAQLK